MITPRWIFAFLLGALTLQPARGPAQTTGTNAVSPWPYVSEGLSPAQEWVWGRLENGVRYVVRNNAMPAGHVSLRLCVQVGFAHESQGERGLAHFVEHMGFNGTTHFPGETLVPELRRHGVAIGPELSAFTFLTHTIYNLEGPSTTPEALDRWFTVLSDFAGGMLFDAKEVQREKGVVTSEIRDHQSPAWRSEVARRNFLYPRSPLSNELVGEVKAVDRKALRAFYDKWYRPERMIVVAVGDADPAKLEELVQKHFSSLRRRTPPPPHFDPSLNIGPRAKTTTFQHDPRVGNLSVDFNSVLPRALDTSAERKRWTARNLALFIINNRFRALARENPARFVSIGASSSFPTPYSTELTIGFAAPVSEWYVGIVTLEQELRRSLEHPFTAEEVREARASMLTNAEQELKSSATSQSTQLATTAVIHAHWGFVSTSTAQNFELVRDTLQQIDGADISREWRNLWPQPRPLIFANGRMPMVKAEEAIDQAVAESRKQPVAAATEKADPSFAYTDFGPPGKIATRDYVKELDLHLLEFENGVKANLKRTTFEASTVYLTTRFGGGIMSEPAGRSGLGAFTAATYLNGGLGRHTPDELRRLMSSSSLSLKFSCLGNTFALDGQASTSSLERLLQLVAADLSDPAWTNEAAALATTQLNTYYSNLAYTPEGTLSLNVFRVLSGGDSRYMPPTPEQLNSRTLEETRQWLAPQLTSSPLELGLVGDFDVEQAIEVLSRTVGALPPRGPATPDERPVRLLKGASTHRFKFQGEAQRSGIQIVWPVERSRDSKVSRQTEVINAILSSRLVQKVREDLGAAYSPSVNFWKSDVNVNDGYVIAYITVKPKQAKRITQLILDIANSFSREGATAAEFEQALAPIVARAAVEQNENGYWVRYIVPRAQTTKDVLQWPMTRLPDLQAITLAEINQLAATILPTSRAITFTSVNGSK